MMAEYKETVERRYYTITGEVPEEAVIEKIISDGQSEQLLKTAIMEHGRGMVNISLLFRNILLHELEIMYLFTICIIIATWNDQIGLTCGFKLDSRKCSPQM